MSTDLWPEFHPEKMLSVGSMLRDAGEGLSDKTEGRVQFRVVTIAAGSEFTHDCSLWAPSLEFDYPIMKVTHGVELFPAKVVADRFPQGIEVKDQADLLERLREIFHSEQVKKMVEQLLLIAA